MNNSSMLNKERIEFDPCIPEDERRFYLKAYPNINLVRERKVHCTVCKMHIGTAPSIEPLIRMHPILRVTHCKKCHDFYNSGEFSKGEDGSELYCRWCGQGGEVYCCSSCPYVFCKSCIITNLSRGVVADIEQNENWSCFNCAPKMLWPLRAQHWALSKFIEKQKKAIQSSNLSESDIKLQMSKDRSLCCKPKKSSGYASDDSDSSDISLSRLKQKSEKRARNSMAAENPPDNTAPVSAKRAKTNDEVVCTPDVLSMLEPECELTVSSNAKTTSQIFTSSPKIITIQATEHTSPSSLSIRTVQSPQIRPLSTTTSTIGKKSIVGPRLPIATATPAAAPVTTDVTTPVYHTINGYRIDLNSAAQQESIRLPNGKLIQVKRQGNATQTITTGQNTTIQSSNPQARPFQAPVTPNITPLVTAPTTQILHSSGGHIIRAQLQTPRSVTVQNPSIIPQFHQHAAQQYQHITIRPQNQQLATIRYQGATPNQPVANIIQNGAAVQLLNGTAITTGGQVATVRQLPSFVRQYFANTQVGASRTQLQNQIINGLETCQHLMGKMHTLTNSNAYKTAKSLTDVKELYIHLSYLLTYAMGRFKVVQDSCLNDLRKLGFTNDANSLENGQLAAEKQASDTEEDELTIVEPKTDTINLDSDAEDETPAPVKPIVQHHPTVIQNHINPILCNVPATITIQNRVPNNSATTGNQITIATPTSTNIPAEERSTEYEFSRVATLLAGMLDIDISENGSSSAPVPKKPRKKTTNKPNPTLLKAKEVLERERLEYMKKNDAKLKMESRVVLERVENVYGSAKRMLEQLKKSKRSKNPDKNILQTKWPQKNIVFSTENTQSYNNTFHQSSMNDKDDSDEIVVLVVEDMDSSPKCNNAVPTNEDFTENLGGDNNISERNGICIMSSQKNFTESGHTNIISNETSKTYPDIQELFKIGIQKATQGEGEQLERGILIDFENNTCEPLTTEKMINHTMGSLVEEIPLENHQNLDDPLNNSNRSHVSFNRVLGRTEVI